MRASLATTPRFITIPFFSERPLHARTFLPFDSILFYFVYAHKADRLRAGFDTENACEEKSDFSKELSPYREAEASSASPFIQFYLEGKSHVLNQPIVFFTLPRRGCGESGPLHPVTVDACPLIRLRRESLRPSGLTYRRDVRARGWWVARSLSQHRMGIRHEGDGSRNE